MRNDPSVRDGISDEPTYSEEGVDLTLIRWSLSLTPTERLRVLQGFVDSVAIMKNARRIP